MHIIDVPIKVLKNLIVKAAADNNIKIDVDDINVIGRSMDNSGFFKVNRHYVGEITFNNEDETIEIILSSLVDINKVYTAIYYYLGEFNESDFLHW